MQRALDSILNHRKFDFHHIFNHKFIGEMRIYLSDKSMRSIVHPDIDNIRANVLMANGCKSMAKIIGSFY